MPCIFSLGAHKVAKRLTREFTSLQMPGFLFTAIENLQTGIRF